VGSATLAAAGVALLALALAALVAGRAPSGRGWSVAPVLAATALGALAWPRTRRGATARGWSRARGSPDEVVRAFGRRGEGDQPVEELLEQLTESLARAFDAARVELWRTGPGRSLVRSASLPAEGPASIELDAAAARVLAGGGVVGPAWLRAWQPELGRADAGGDLRAAAAAHAGELLAVAVVARPPGSDRFDPAEDAALGELAAGLGVALRNRQLDTTLRETMADLRRTNAELRASRVRLVSAADAERRRLERDLHDGAQQHLVTLAVNLRLVADEVAADPAVAPDRLRELGEGLREAIAELRSLAHGIYPPVLMDAGLVEALRVAARRSASPVAVTVGGLAPGGADESSFGRLVAEVEAAAYFCCTEALQNAAKHAPGAPVRVDLDLRDDLLSFTVDDDGPGMPHDVGAPRAGHGLVNMADRLGAVGGRLELGPSPSGGVRVRGLIPLGDQALDLTGGA